MDTPGQSEILADVLCRRPLKERTVTKDRIILLFIRMAEISKRRLIETDPVKKLVEWSFVVNKISKNFGMGSAKVPAEMLKID